MSVCVCVCARVTYMCVYVCLTYICLFVYICVTYVCVCVCVFQPLYGLLQAKLQLITHAYFEEKDFSQIDILKVRNSSCPLHPHPSLC